VTTPARSLGRLAMRRHLHAAVLLLACTGCLLRRPAATLQTADEREAAGVAAYRQGDYATARTDLEAARRIHEAKGDRGLSYSRLLMSLAEVERLTGNGPGAEALVRESLAIRQRLLPPGDAEIGRTLTNLGLILDSNAKPAEAEQTYAQAIVNLEKALGPEHVDVAMPLSNLSDLLRRTNRCAEAESIARRSLAIREAMLPPAHPDVGRSLGAVAAAVACDPSRYLEAEGYYTRAIAAWEASLGPDHPHLALGLKGWAGSAAAAGHLDVAEQLYARALRIQEARLPAGHASLADTRRRYEAVRRARAETTVGTHAAPP
jgi:tetratricopeptide (TPR) repeat protein